MKTLEDEVRSVVTSFMNSGELFTALDVSNKVKLSMPFARHREVRDAVRGMFTSDIESAGWARTPITVTLADGTTADALLYHPLSDAWDLDNKYDAQKRSQGTVKAVPVVPALSPTPAVPATVTVVTTPTVVSTLAKDRWAQLFSTQPSLFPLK